MNSSWLQKPSIHERGEGLRPGVERLMALVDRDDPALPVIADLLAEMRQAGVELEERAIRIAVQLGRHRASNPVKRTTRVPRQAKADAPSESIVYYAKRGSLAKIGTTCTPRTRFNDLMPDDILAFEPGSYELEAQRHQQFRHLRVGGTEHFQITDGLLEHTRSLRAQHGDPDPQWPSQANLEQFLGSRQVLPRPDSPRSALLVTASEGADECGLNRSTVHMWVHRGLLKPAGESGSGRRMFFLDHIEQLASASTASRRSA